MITRIVRMSFEPDSVEHFEKIFDESKELIRGFEGCKYLSLHKDAQAANVFYTLSNWLSEDHLNNYRASELFKTTWAKTKILFNEKPQAFSLEKQVDLI